MLDTTKDGFERNMVNFRLKSNCGGWHDGRDERPELALVKTREK
jgi:hypothetical protein